MNNSPYLSNEKKAYIKNSGIEENLQQIVNQLLRELPSDPYAYIAQKFQKFASDQIKIVDLNLIKYQNLNVQTAKIIFEVEYYNTIKKIHINSVCQNVNDVEEQQKIIESFQKLKFSLRNKLIKDISTIDSVIDDYNQQSESIQKLGNYVSFSVPELLSKVTNQPVHQIYQDIFKSSTIQAPKIMLSALVGSKLLNSKCKPYKFFLIFDNNVSFDQIYNLCLNMKTQISSGKAGASAYKYYKDGTIITPFDTINDNLKFLEEHIKKVEAQCTIGINWMADNLFNSDTRKYELENPKQQLDENQLIDFYLKLSTDRPLISYMEDLVIEDKEQQILLMDKFSETKVQIGSSKFLDNLKKITEIDYNNTSINKLSYASYNPQTDFKNITQFAEIVKKNRSKKTPTNIIIKENEIETTNTEIVDLAFAISGSMLQLGNPLQSERLQKYDRYFQLLQELKI